MIQVQPYAVDISEWRADDNYGLAYPEGARPKRAVFSPPYPPPGIKPNWRYLFKLSARNYPEQYWAEIIAYLVGTEIGVDVPPAYAAFDLIRGQCGALIEWFYEEDRQLFLPAGDVFQRLIPDFDRAKGTQHNLIDAMKFSKHFLGSASIPELARMLLFDALIGNSDRHQDNWGYILEPTPGEPGSYLKTFSPWFDNGTSMGHERMPRKFKVWADADYNRYIRKGCHHFRLGRNDPNRLTHLDSMSLIKENAPRLSTLLYRTLQRFSLERLRSALDQLGALETLEHGLFSEDRGNFIYRLFEYRANLIGAILK